MRDFLKKIKADFLLSSLGCIGLGIVFIIWKDSVLGFMGSAFAIILIIMGAVDLCSYFMRIISNGMSVLTGIVLLAVGIWFLIDPKVIVTLIPIVIGVVLLFHGIRGLMEVYQAKKFGSNAWMVGMVMAIISVLLGVACIVNAFGIMQKATMIVGIILIYNGVSNIWIAGHAAKAEDKYKKTVDVEFVEDRYSRK